jgi:hypothetical protein
MPSDQGPRWMTLEEFDTSAPVHPRLPDDASERIARAYLASSRGSVGPVGRAAAALLHAPDLLEFAVSWIEDTVRRSL